MGYFLCTLTHGPAWDGTRDPRTQDGWTEHAAFMDSLVEDPWAIDGHLLVDVLEPWSLWLDGRGRHTRRG